jgi:hypothetical protein
LGQTSLSLTAANLYPVNPKLGMSLRNKSKRKVADLNASLNSSSNSWMNSSQNSEKESVESGSGNSRKLNFLQTASKLGRKLIVMDKKSDQVKVKKVEVAPSNKNNNINKKKVDPKKSAEKSHNDAATTGKPRLRF